jgi:hypothetical protein
MKVLSSWIASDVSPYELLLEGIANFLYLSDLPVGHIDLVSICLGKVGRPIKYSSGVRKCLRVEPNGETVNPKGIQFGHGPRVVELCEASARRLANALKRP